jgi:hypothetical protein
MSIKREIEIGDEFVTKSPANAHGKYVLEIVSIEKSENDNPEDDRIEYSETDMKYSKSGSAKFSTRRGFGRRWWFNDYCLKLKRNLVRP